MKRAMILILGLAILSAVIGQRSVEYSDQEVDRVEVDRDAEVTKNYSEDDSASKSVEVDKERDLKVTNSYDHEKDFKKADKEFHECAEKRGKGYNRGEGRHKSGINEWKTRQGGYEEAHKTGHHAHHRKGNFHHEQLDEKAHIAMENGKHCGGERVRAQKCIRKTHQRRGFNDNHGANNNERLVRRTGTHLRKAKSDRFEEDCKSNGRFEEAGSDVHVHRRAKEVDVEVKGQRQKEIEVDDKHKDTKAVNKKEQESDKYAVERDNSIQRTATNIRKVDVDREDNNDDN